MKFISRLRENLEKGKFIDSFRENIWGVDLDDIESLSKYNKGTRYLLCAIGLFTKYAWVAPLKERRGITIVNAF